MTLVCVAVAGTRIWGPAGIGGSVCAGPADGWVTAGRPGWATTRTWGSPAEPEWLTMRAAAWEVGGVWLAAGESMVPSCGTVGEETRRTLGGKRGEQETSSGRARERKGRESVGGETGSSPGAGFRGFWGSGRAALADCWHGRRGDRRGGQGWRGGRHRGDRGGRHAGVTEAHLALLRRATAEGLQGTLLAAGLLGGERDPRADLTRGTKAGSALAPGALSLAALPATTKAGSPLATYHLGGRLGLLLKGFSGFRGRCLRLVNPLCERE